ncbi:hypothetical protein M422DRAFT_46516 [Sphaerobolus stellatus SS14]|uniref:DUF6534 domain-containing protein n=1 Tax=Sphaerobolus stellatus (strain SS14) TaxID=990650 RepID=A0A0C9VTP0_SPHS4|nr:hypothetical protein M422DRAFT_46516 [Sphaerobolus stellatus SS14]
MIPSFDATWGMWLVALWLDTILYGCGILQTWLYFHWYPSDHWGIKAMVSLKFFRKPLACSLTNNSGFYSSACRNAASVDFLCYDLQLSYPELWELACTPNRYMVQLMTGYLTYSTQYLCAFIVQLYFAYCIYAFFPCMDESISVDRTKKLAPISIILLAFGSLVVITGIGKLDQIESTEPITITQTSLALLCDIIITVSLVRTLDGHRSGLRSTNTMLNMLIINAINRGMLTTVCAAFNIILSKTHYFQFIALPDTFYFFIPFVVASKLYMNSALAT